MILKILKWFTLLLVGAVAGLWFFWPDNFAVKGPMWDFITGKQLGAPSDDTIRNRFKLPDGFRLGVFAADVPNARVMRMTATGDMVISSMRPGNVILLHADADGDGVSDGRTTLFSGLDTPHGLALHDGYLYVAEMTQISRARFNAAARTVGEREVIFAGMPAGGNHRTRTIGIGTDGMLYVTVGSSCNVCVEEQPYRAEMVRMNADGSGAATYATGLRNTVGFDWQPATGHLYGTDNGRDLLGDDTPHCELNHIEVDADYGWPWAYDDKVVDPDYGPGNEDKVAASKGMAHGFGAHRAPLGIRFLQPGLEPAGFEGAALVALHGSWNRSTLAGYKVVSLHFDDGGNIEQRDFLTGFEENEDVIGRPADVVQGSDGAIYIADDYAGAVYRVGFGDLTVAGTAITREITDPLKGLEGADIPALSTRGAALYTENDCAQCHDPAQAAEGVAVKKLDGLAMRYDATMINGLLQAPPGTMPSYDFTEDERKALAAYLLTRGSN